MAETVSSIKKKTTVITSETGYYYIGHQNAKLVLGAKQIKSTRIQPLPSGKYSVLNTS